MLQQGRTLWVKRNGDCALVCNWACSISCGSLLPFSPAKTVLCKRPPSWIAWGKRDRKKLIKKKKKTEQWHLQRHKWPVTRLNPNITFYQEGLHKFDDITLLFSSREEARFPLSISSFYFIFQVVHFLFQLYFSSWRRPVCQSQAEVLKLSKQKLLKFQKSTFNL